MRYHDDSSELITVFDPTPEDVARADQERLGEDIRKLYVALTRSRFATWVGVAEIENWHLSGLGYLLGDESATRQPLGDALNLLTGGHPELCTEPLPAATELHYAEEAPATLGPALISIREAREDWWIAELLLTGIHRSHRHGRCV